MILISLGVFLGISLLLGIVWRIWHPKSLGFNDKTLWDWLSLLAVPLVVGFATFLISAAQTQIEQDRAAESALQQYFSRVTELALDERLIDRPDMMEAIGRAETMAILRLVEDERAGRAFAFLAEMNLLDDFAVEFESIDLAGAELEGINLEGLDFEGSDLSGSDFEGANLRLVDFEEADLGNADLKETDLRRANFDATNLKGAEMRGADLRGADLQQAIGLSSGQIAQACVDKTTFLPADFDEIIAPSTACVGLDGH